MIPSAATDRAVGDVVGFVLVFGLVATVVAIIAVAGFGSLEDVRDAEQINNAERAFDVLADNTADVFREGAPSRATEVSLEAAQLDVTTSVRLNLSGRAGGSNTVISNVFVQPIVWRSARTEDAQIAYELGAVMRSDRTGGVVVRDPPFVLESDLMLFPIVKTETDTELTTGGSTVRVRTIADKSFDETEGIDQNGFDEIWINITSPRAKIWQSYFEDKAVTRECFYETPGDDERVRCELAPPENLFVTLHVVDLEIEQ